MTEGSTKRLESLREPFPWGELDYKPGSFSRDGKSAMVLFYITARHVQDRLDEVFPESWSFEWAVVSETPPTAKGRLLIGDRKYEDVGNADKEGENAWKGAVSDALKRCAVQVGIGRYLYSLPSVWAKCETWDKGGKPQLGKWLEDPIIILMQKLGLELPKPGTSRAQEHNAQSEATNPRREETTHGAPTNEGGYGTTCVECGASVPPAVKVFCEAKGFGKTLCREHQPKGG